MEQADMHRLLNFFKVLAHESRLRLLGFLAEQEYSVSELAKLMNLKDPTVSHHLGKFVELGLVTMRQDGTTHYYRLDATALQRLNKELLTPEKVATFSNESGSDDWESRVRRAFIDGETIKQLPQSFKKELVILKWLAEKFERDRRYPEKELNEIIKQHHPDYATLRRDMVDCKFMARENSVYWRLPQEVTDHQIEVLLSGNFQDG